eukprot:2925027-Alexandrium_andersonii.AAC.1
MEQAHHLLQESSALARQAKLGMARARGAAKGTRGRPHLRSQGLLAGPSPATSELKAGPDLGQAREGRWGTCLEGRGRAAAAAAEDGFASGTALRAP